MGETGLRKLSRHGATASEITDMCYAVLDERGAMFSVGLVEVIKNRWDRDVSARRISSNLLNDERFYGRKVNTGWHGTSRHIEWHLAGLN